MVNLISSARRFLHEKASSEAGPNHERVAINPKTGDAAVIYHYGTTQKTVVAALYRRGTDPVNKDNVVWYAFQKFTLGDPSLNLFGASNDSCQNPWIHAIEGGFACYWVRQNLSVGSTTMSVGAQLECAKLGAPTSATGSYTKYASATAGKGYVIDDQIIFGECGVMPRACWTSRDDGIVVYGHQTAYTLVAQAVDRLTNLRAAGLNWTANGKPSFISASTNFTGGATGDDAIGAAGAQTYLIQNLQNDDSTAAPNNWYSGGGGYLLPSVRATLRGEIFIAVEIFDDTAGAAAKGVIWTYLYSPVRSGSPMVLLDSSVANVHDATTALRTVRRPMLAAPYWWEEEPAYDAGGMQMLLCYTEEESDSNPNDSFVSFKTIKYPFHGSVTEVVAAVAVQANTNYDGTADEQRLPDVACASFLEVCVMQQKMLSAAGQGGMKYLQVVHSDGSAEYIRSELVNYMERPACDAVVCRDGKKLFAVAYEGSDDGSSDGIYLMGWQF